MKTLTTLTFKWEYRDNFYSRKRPCFLEKTLKQLNQNLFSSFYLDARTSTDLVIILFILIHVENSNIL